jgi:hypothetical protein
LGDIVKLKWKVLVVFVVLYVIGIVGAAWHTYDATDPSKATPTVEALKIIFIMLGGLGVIVPTYLNIWQSLEATEQLNDQNRRNKVENTFRLLERWDDRALFEARRFTRELGDQQGSLSPDQLKTRIKEKPELRQSVILVFNYFDLIRVSVENDRVDPKVIGSALGAVFHNMYYRFKPWIEEQSKQYQQDLEKLAQMLPKGS